MADTAAPAGVGPGGFYLDSLLAPLATWLERPDVTDIYVNHAQELWVETLGGAILQSVLDIGVALATGAVTDGDSVIVNVPQSAQQVTGQVLPPPPQPRLSIEQGTSVSVFVARDLDFSTVDG